VQDLVGHPARVQAHPVVAAVLEQGQVTLEHVLRPVEDVRAQLGVGEPGREGGEEVNPRVFGSKTRFEQRTSRHDDETPDFEENCQGGRCNGCGLKGASRERLDLHLGLPSPHFRKLKRGGESPGQHGQL
jgi:hypothetical protein